MIEPGPDPQAVRKSSSWRIWLIALLLGACYALAYLDRQIISLLIKPIKASLDVSDTEFGLLQGVSFSLFFVITTYPLAWLADRTRHSWVMAGSVAGWSLMTMTSGLAHSFTQLMFSRIGVAVGEAGLTPAAQATLGERFDRRPLAVATSLFMLAPFVGGGLALSVGAALYTWAQHLPATSLPTRMGIQAWQLVFLIVGAFGLIPAALLLLINDRRQNKAAASDEVRISEVFALFRREWRIFMLYPIAMAFVMVVLASYVTWLPAQIMRSKDVGEAQIGALFGPVYVIAGVTGTLLAGLIVAVRGGPNPVRTVLLYILTVLSLLWPLSILGQLVSSLTAELTIMGMALFLISSVTSLSGLTYQYLTPQRLRAQAMAIMAMITALAGTGLGPVLAGFLSDHLQGSRYPLSTALALIGAVCVPCALTLMGLVLREHQRRRLDLKLPVDDPAHHWAVSPPSTASSAPVI